MQIPSNDVCREMILEMGMLDHILDHSRQVCRVALFLCERLAACSVSLDWRLVFAGALLHDITKTRSFTTGENHAETGGVYLRGKGFQEVADIVRQHVCLDQYPDPPVIDEAAVVNYADKRVLNDQIVTLKERMLYILDRYGKIHQCKERFDWLWGKSLGIETAIFQTIAISPETLPAAMDKITSPPYGIRLFSMCS